MTKNGEFNEKLNINSGSHLITFLFWTAKLEIFISLVYRLGTAFGFVLPSSNAARKNPTFVGRFQIEAPTYIFLWDNIFAQQIISRCLSPTWSSLKTSYKITALCTLLLTENTARNRVITEFNLLVMESQCYISQSCWIPLLKTIKQMESCSDPKELWKKKGNGSTESTDNPESSTGGTRLVLEHNTTAESREWYTYFILQTRKSVWIFTLTYQ